MKVSVKPVPRRKAQKSTCSTTAQNGTKSDGDCRCFLKMEEGVEVAKRYCYALSESQWNRGHFSVRKWESEKHQSCSIPAEGFKGYVTTDGSLLGMTRKWRACGWSVVQLDFVQELGPLYGMYGPMEAEFEVRRTIKRAELTAFLCLLKEVIGPTMVHGDAHMSIKIWEELHLLVSKEILVEMEHVKAHRSKKDKKDMSHFERFAAEGNEKVDELAEEGAMLDEEITPAESYAAPAPVGEYMAPAPAIAASKGYTFCGATGRCEHGFSQELLREGEAGCDNVSHEGDRERSGHAELRHVHSERAHEESCA